MDLDLASFLTISNSRYISQGLHYCFQRSEYNSRNTCMHKSIWQFPPPRPAFVVCGTSYDVRVQGDQGRAKFSGSVSAFLTACISWKRSKTWWWEGLERGYSVLKSRHLEISQSDLRKVSSWNRSWKLCSFPEPRPQRAPRTGTSSPSFEV